MRPPPEDGRTNQACAARPAGSPPPRARSRPSSRRQPHTAARHELHLVSAGSFHHEAQRPAERDRSRTRARTSTAVSPSTSAPALAQPDSEDLGDRDRPRPHGPPRMPVTEAFRARRPPSVEVAGRGDVPRATSRVQLGAADSLRAAHRQHVCVSCSLPRFLPLSVGQAALDRLL